MTPGLDMSLETLSQVRQSDVVEEPFAGAVVGSPFHVERRCSVMTNRMPAA